MGLAAPLTVAALPDPTELVDTAEIAAETEAEAEDEVEETVAPARPTPFQGRVYWTRSALRHWEYGLLCSVVVFALGQLTLRLV